MGVSKINGISYSNIAKIGGKTVAQISKVAGQTASAAGGDDGVSRVVAAFDDAYVSWVDIADDGDVSEWETNLYKAGAGGDTWDMVDIAFGKDGDGGKRPILTTASQRQNGQPQIRN